MTTVSATRRIKADVNLIWGFVGDFGRYAEWHPTVIECSLEDGGRQRRLTSQCWLPNPRAIGGI